MVPAGDNHPRVLHNIPEELQDNEEENGVPPPEEGKFQNNDYHL